MSTPLNRYQAPEQREHFLISLARSIELEDPFTGHAEDVLRAKFVESMEYNAHKLLASVYVDDTRAHKEAQAILKQRRAMEAAHYAPIVRKPEPEPKPAREPAPPSTRLFPLPNAQAITRVILPGRSGPPVPRPALPPVEMAS